MFVVRIWYNLNNKVEKWGILMDLHVSFNLIFLTIFITIFITGYIRGAGIELLRVLKVVIPFFILYFFGDEITNRLFASEKIISFVYGLLPSIPYKNTIAALSTQILLYMLVYLFLAIFLWRIGKYLLDERIEYFFGRSNAIMGGVFSLVRMYIILSVLIIPFYIFNFTNRNDEFTNIILNHPPMFSRMGHVLDDAKPTLDKFNEVSASFKIMDLDSLRKYTTLLTDVQSFLSEKEEAAFEVYRYLKETNQIHEEYTDQASFLYYYTNHVDEMEDYSISDKELFQINKKLNAEVQQYQAVIIWAYDEQIKDKNNLDDIVDSFIHNYQKIAADTDDELTIDLLAKTKLKTQIYLALTTFLDESFGIQVKTNQDLWEDETIKIVLENYHHYEVNLIERINDLDIKPEEKDLIIKQIDKFSIFQQAYLNHYKHYISIYDVLLKDVSFKYKLGFAIAKDKDLSTVIDQNIEENPIIYLLLIDSIDFLGRFESNQSIDFQSGQLFIALFLVSIEEENGILTYNEIQYDQLMERISQHKAYQKEYSTINQTLNEVINSLFIKKDGESYLSYLLEEGFITRELIIQLYQSPEINELLDPTNRIYLKTFVEDLESEVSV